MSVLEPIRSRGSGAAGIVHGNEWSWFNHARYDSLKRLTSATNPESGTISYSYDNDGNMIKRTDPRGFITCFGNLSGSTCDGTGYDTLNRTILKTYNSSAGTPQVNWTWGTSAPNVGRLLSVSNSNSTTSFTYSSSDALGRPATSTQTTAGTPYGFSYSYYPIGLETIEYPSNRQVTYTYL